MTEYHKMWIRIPSETEIMPAPIASIACNDTAVKLIYAPLALSSARLHAVIKKFCEAKTFPKFHCLGRDDYWNPVKENHLEWNNWTWIRVPFVAGKMLATVPVNSSRNISGDWLDPFWTIMEPCPNFIYFLLISTKVLLVFAACMYYMKCHGLSCSSYLLPASSVRP